MLYRLKPGLQLQTWRVAPGRGREAHRPVTGLRRGRRGLILPFPHLIMEPTEDQGSSGTLLRAECRLEPVGTPRTGPAEAGTPTSGGTAVSGEGPAYSWRRLSPEQRKVILEERRRRPRPWHGPPHIIDPGDLYLVSAACYEHRHVIGISPGRIGAFEADLLDAAAERAQQIFAWNVLPNHYHILVQTPDILGLLHGLGRLHGRPRSAGTGRRTAGGGKPGTARRRRR